MGNDRIDDPTARPPRTRPTTLAVDPCGVALSEYVLGAPQVPR